MQRNSTKHQESKRLVASSASEQIERYRLSQSFHDTTRACTAQHLPDTVHLSPRGALPKIMGIDENVTHYV